ncbi:MAG TPA: DUF2339 domain-containing protein [Longimicrobiaceae bacterium]|nr:DUF2339 domain-containing protein [Longimicrobiaceae bacterium]
MAPEDPALLEQRLSRLEGLVEELLRRTPEIPASIVAPPPVTEAEEPRAPASVPPSAGVEESLRGKDRAAARKRVASDWDHWVDNPGLMEEGAGPARAADEDHPRVRFDGQLWLNRLGILLVLVAIALLFRYSIDRGWLTPVVRVAFGAATGLVMLGAGFWLDVRRQRFVSVLYGGGMAVFYIVGFAAFYVYELVGYGTAAVGLCAVTAATFLMAVWKDEQALALLAALGGLGIPVILGIDHGKPLTFAIYVSFLLAWTTALYLRRGWRRLHWFALVGGWTLLCAYAFMLHFGRPSVADRWALQGVALFAWLATAALPIAQELRRGPRLPDPEAQPVARAGTAGDDDEDAELGPEGRDALHWHGVAILPALLALAVTSLVWSPTVHQWGAAALVAAGIYGLAGMLSRDDNEPLSVVLLLAGSLLLSIGTVAAFDGDALLLILAGEALALHVLASRAESALLTAVGHLLYAGAAWWLVIRFTQPSAHEPIAAAANLGVIATGIAISMRMEGVQAAGYRMVAHGLALAWLWTVLAPYSEGWVTVAWGVYGLVLLLYAMQARHEQLERVGIGTLLLVVAKLFLVDLARVDALWRVLLFLGIGIVFLSLSYVLQSRFKRHDGAGAEAEGS